MAKRSGLSESTIGRIWKKFDLKPHLTDGFKVSSDPLFVEKVVDVVGLYHNPPDKAVVLCVDEESQIQALDRSQQVLAMMPGMPERRTHDYARNGITSLFAAFNIADGTVISQLQRRHRHQEFLKFLKTIDKNVPAELEVHLVCDNYGTHHTPEIQDWLARHLRFRMHFTPTRSSWIDQIERWFGYLTDQLIRPGVHKSVQALEKDIRAWIENWTRIRGRSRGRKQPRRSSIPSPNILRGFQAEDTSGLPGQRKEAPTSRQARHRRTLEQNDPGHCRRTESLHRRQ